MNIIRGIKTPSFGNYIFPVKTKIFNSHDENGNQTRKIEIVKDSDVVEKSKKSGLYNEETVKIFLDTINQSKQPPNFDSINYQGVVFLPENPQVLKDYIAALNERAYLDTIKKREILKITRGLPVFGSDGKKAFEDREKYLTSNRYHGNDVLFNSSDFSREYDSRLIHLTPMGEYYFHGGASVIFSETLLVLPFFLTLNDFLEYGDDNQTIRQFLSNKENWEKINSYFAKGHFPHHSVTKELSRAFYNTGYGHRSFLYPSKSGSSILNKVSELTKSDLEFWIENYEKEFISSPSDKLKKQKIDLWIEFVKNRGKIGKSKQTFSRKLIDDSFDKAYQKYRKEILPTAESEYGKETAKELENMGNIAFTSLAKKREREKNVISFILYAIKSHRPDYDLENISLFTTLLLYTSLKNPGIFFKGGGRANLEAVIMDTLETFDYDGEKLADILFFLATDSTIPQFNKSQWKSFVELIKEQNLTERGNLAIYASVIIPNTKGKNDSETRINTQVFEALRNIERTK